MRHFPFAEKNKVARYHFFQRYLHQQRRLHLVVTVARQYDAKVASAELIPTAASIPVTAMEEKGEKALACGKDKLVIFYCGGPT